MLPRNPPPTVALVFSVVLAALAAATDHAAVAQGAAGVEKPIQDNSFLLEEAYNQEPGVVQTIHTFSRTVGSGDWIATLTQEWPVGGQTSQLSFTLPVQAVGGTEERARGAGDLALNYRYQLVGSGVTKLAVSPRLSVIVPTGDYRRGLGAGGTGLQVDLPVSLVLSKNVVAHTNAGFTYVVSARDEEGDVGDLTHFNVGQSFVWLAHRNVNVLVETLLTSTQNLDPVAGKERKTDLFVSPGVRAALNLPHDLQIVGGIAVPIGVGPSHGDRALFLYLSVELPFWKPGS